MCYALWILSNNSSCCFFLGGCAARKHEAASWWQISCFPMGPLLYLGCGKIGNVFLILFTMVICTYSIWLYIYGCFWLFWNVFRYLFSVDPQCTLNSTISVRFEHILYLFVLPAPKTMTNAGSFNCPMTMAYWYPKSFHCPHCRQFREGHRMTYCPRKIAWVAGVFHVGKFWYDLGQLLAYVL